MPIDINTSCLESKANKHRFSKVASVKILIVNIDIQGRLINGQTGNISQIEFALGSVCKVYVKFSDKQTVLKAIRSYYLDRQNSWVPIEK